MAIERLGEGTLGEKQGLIDDMMGDLNGPGRLFYADYIAYNENDDQKASFFRCENLFEVIAEKFPIIDFEVLDHLANHCKDNPEWLANFLKEINIPDNFEVDEFLDMFRSVTVGQYKEKKDFIEEFRKSCLVGNRIEEQINDPDFKLSQEKIVKEVVMLQIRQLSKKFESLNNEVPIIYQEARNKGLVINEFSGEIAPYLLMESTKRERFSIFLPGIEAGDDIYEFSAENDDEKHLYVDVVNSESTRQWYIYYAFLRETKKP